jgi:calcineurin-like phosphoesterase family protein
MPTPKHYFTSDPHFGHEGVLKFSDRHFSSIEEHDETLLDEINTLVGRDDILWMLGDVSFKPAGKWRARIKCRKIHFIVGNHDHNKSKTVFSSADYVKQIKLDKHLIYVSHYPNAYWPASHYGSLHLYGHMHRMREETLDACFPGRRSMDVGVDNAFYLYGKYRPFRWVEEIRDVLLARPGHDPLEFYRNWELTNHRQRV